MVRPFLPLNALRAFEASARHLSFTRAAIELSVTQAAVSHQVKLLEERLKTQLFRRLPRGLLITAEGEALLPVLRDSFDRMADVLERFEGGHLREVLNVGCVGTFATGWLLPRITDFQQQFPYVDVRLSTNNNRVDIAAEGLDFTIKFGDGSWQGTQSVRLIDAPLTALCIPRIARSLERPGDLHSHTLLRSYRADEWTKWFEAAGAPMQGPPQRSIVFDSSIAMMETALQGQGVALCPPLMFQRHVASGDVEQPFDVHISLGSYWLTRLKSRHPSKAMLAFEGWLLGTCEAG
ncbi:LysR family transcriptional regulator [Rhizobiaceae bacterium n13]|uniref:LysR family transcriptional regulator n=1 Tax=Ferirhizobium litorale TaxID=2927786 RepID=A0AAE3QA21_9HYPH|nr:LysR family transcriptional regulator [Fererhizobium litorale]MDI7861691.1 LysR family transcriptional regulator [Fererhizobium litorale]MDI7921967.1 LysR family transcriptional regulator [Fererhizobium litorale]